jgi:hypothetical protein
MKNKIFNRLLILVLWLSGCGEEFELEKFDELNAPHTLTERRTEFRNNTVRNTIQANLNTELTSSTEENYMSAFWGMGLTNFSNEFTFLALKEAFRKADTLSIKFQRSLLEITYQLYPKSFGPEIDNLMNSTANPKILAMCIEYLVRNNYDDRSGSYYLPQIYDRFPGWQNDAILYMLEKSLTPDEEKRPPLLDLLSHDFGGDKIIIYSFHRRDRNYTGLTVLKNDDGAFVRTENGQVFSTPHFARSVSDLPEYLTNGNTPQGIFSIQGIGVSENQFIGTTPNLQLVMPFEAETGTFRHDEDSKDDWSIDLYKELLPDKWKNYLGIFGSYFAGKAGRSEIIAHGTTINPDYYIGKTYYPNTPSLGCITALELWDGKSGGSILSYQIEFMNAYLDAGGGEGYFVLVELDNKSQPVVLEEIINEIIKAERMSL